MVDVGGFWKQSNCYVINAERHRTFDGLYVYISNIIFTTLSNIDIFSLFPYLVMS